MYISMNAKYLKGRVSDALKLAKELPMGKMKGRALLTIKPAFSNDLTNQNNGLHVLSITATDLEITATFLVLGDSDEEEPTNWAGVIDLAALHDYLKNAKSERAALSLEPAEKGFDGSELLGVACGNSRVLLNVLPATQDNYPLTEPLTRPDVVDPLILEAPHVTRAFKQVLPAVEKSGNRPILNTMLMKSSPGQVTLVASDSFRLHVADMVIAHGNNPQWSSLVPSKAAKFLIENLTGAELVEFYLTEQSVVVGNHVGNEPTTAVTTFWHAATRDMLIQTQCLDGSYPPYETIIPKYAVLGMAVKRLELLEAARVASAYARASANTLYLKHDGPLTDGKLIVRAVDIARGEIESELPYCEPTLNDPGWRVALNCNYLMDALNAVDTDYVRFGTAVNSGTAPVAVYPVGSNGFKAVIMPITLSRDPDYRARLER
jgi:DNA polymerase-3 subunit beta